MTEGPPPQHDKPMCVRIWLEVGHACEPRHSALGRALALDWRVWVRGIRDQDISAFVHKVVFHLNPPTAFVYPKRVLQEPPYEIQESGCASIDIPIYVYLKHSTKPKKIRLKYSLHIENNAQNNSESRCIYYDVENPSEQLWRSLMKGGGEVVARTCGSHHRANKLIVVLSDDTYNPKYNGLARTKKKYKFVEPIRCKHGPRKRIQPYLLDEICSKCGESTNINFANMLRAASMTEDEIERVTQLYWAFAGYEKSVDALTLPPLSDPIYKMPELPASLRRAMLEVDAA